MDFLIPAAYAQTTPAPAGAGGMGMFLPLILMFVLMYFLLFRPQQKRMAEHRKLVEAIARGDEVLTSGGIAGRVEEVGPQFLTIEVAPGVKIRVQKHAIANILPKGSLDAN